VKEIQGESEKEMCAVSRTAPEEEYIKCVGPNVIVLQFRYGIGR